MRYTSDTFLTAGLVNWSHGLTHHQFVIVSVSIDKYDLSLCKTQFESESSEQFALLQNTQAVQMNAI